MDTYNSLAALESAFLEASTSNTRSVFEDERIYYLSEDHSLGLSLEKINVSKGYFNCKYGNEIMLITNRGEDGHIALEVMVDNNSEIFTKQQVGNLEYYYIYEKFCNYYFFEYDGYLLQINIPDDSEMEFGDMINYLTYMEIS